MENILFAESTTPAQTEPKPAGSFLIFTLVITILLIINLYFLIKFFFYYKKSIDKTKSILGEYLVKKYIQGINLRSNGFFNIFFIGCLILAQIILSSVSLSRVYANFELNKSYIPIFSAGIATGVILLLSLIFGQVAIYFIKFNYPQYKLKKDSIHSELLSLKEFKRNELNANYPEKIQIDFDKLRQENVLLFNLFQRWMNFYNNMNAEVLVTKKHQKISEDAKKQVQKSQDSQLKTKKQFSFQKQYNLFLNQLFKIIFFGEAIEEINKKEALKQEFYQDKLISSKPKNLQANNADKQNDLEKEIAWMSQMDDKAKIIQENKKITTLSKEEFKKKYEEYVYVTRSMDPLYQGLQKNSWLFYRDSEIEDLFFNVNTSISYHLNEEEFVYEKELSEFLKEYKDYLISKFLLTR
ncbi:ABC transporter permease [Metamycoplasma alkalescens]|uniref:Uncharacterized protein n=2 Tax=Metamycoplasma alkalescens TaxID=45363 RepID=A0A318U4C2_9BACT|nr:ABC transporter permease [Metamycoplasma alkalescens]PYF42231.1 hypothetical protein BCF88_1137 [Metamycoplasma alkalescens]